MTKIYRLTPERYDANQKRRAAERKEALFKGGEYETPESIARTRGVPICPGVKPAPSAAFGQQFDKAKQIVADYMEGKRAREFTLLLPCPQSVNHNSLPNGQGGRYLTPEHKTFRQEVAHAVYMDKIAKLYGPLDVEILINAPRIDIDNVVKPTLDALQRAGAIENDRNVYELRVARSKEIPDGCISVKVGEM